MQQELSFSGNTQEIFTKILHQKLQAAAMGPTLREQARRLLWIKAGLYFGIFLLLYLSLFWWPPASWRLLLIRYLGLGFISILMALNIAHDAAHGNFSKNKMVNNLIFTTTFSLLGVNAYFWKIRHTASHHIFPNVDGGDVDIEDNPIVRLCPHRAYRSFYRWQHYYAPVLYAFFTLYWVLVKDFVYFRKDRIGNLSNLQHPPAEVFQLFLWKAIYFLLFLGLPIWIVNLPFGWVITAWLLMHLFLSELLVLTLITSHLTMETAFPAPNKSGQLPYPYYWHQLATSMDFYPTSRIANWIWGGFNAHTAHHVFPNWPHTAYPKLSVLVQEAARAAGYPYNEQSFVKSLRSHFRFLRQMGQPKEAAMKDKTSELTK